MLTESILNFVHEHKCLSTSAFGIILKDPLKKWSFANLEYFFLTSQFHLHLLFYYTSLQ